MLSTSTARASAEGLEAVTASLLRSIWIGFDPREAAAFAVARHSIKRQLSQPIPIMGLVLSDLQKQGLYTRPTSIRTNSEGRIEMVDEISKRPDYDGRISTQHANARFLVPHLAKTGWAAFLDGDILARSNLSRMFDKLDSKYAAYCVKHNHQPSTTTKMDAQVQTKYARKNWSSVMVWNLEHPANRALTLEMVNTLPGKELHRLCWLDDGLIGALDPKYNHLVGEVEHDPAAFVAHFTCGVPDMPGYEAQPFANEWRDELARWAA